jgi:hypothetical protein
MRSIPWWYPSWVTLVAKVCLSAPAGGRGKTTVLAKMAIEGSVWMALGQRTRKHVQQLVGDKVTCVSSADEKSVQELKSVFASASPPPCLLIDEPFFLSETVCNYIAALLESSPTTIAIAIGTQHKPAPSMPPFVRPGWSCFSMLSPSTEATIAAVAALPGPPVPIWSAARRSAACEEA